MFATALSAANRRIYTTSASSQDSTGAIRKRVCKACDRCRLKKTKCDGSSPCFRCKVDDAICAFGEGKISRGKVYPKGYAEILERQQNQLVSGLKEMYYRLQKASAWDGALLDESSGHPLTHDILSALDILQSKHDGIGEPEAIEENCENLQSKKTPESVGLFHRRGHLPLESKPTPYDRTTTACSRHDTPSELNLQHHTAQLPVKPSDFQGPTSNNGPQLCASEWAQAFADINGHHQTGESEYVLQGGGFTTFNPWDLPQTHVESYGEFPSYQTHVGRGNCFDTGRLSDIIDLGQFGATGFDYGGIVLQ